MKKVVILLTWKRLKSLDDSLKNLLRQRDQDFDVHISNGNLAKDAVKSVELSASTYAEKGLRIKVSHDGNKYSCFRRFFIAKEYAEAGYDVVFFLDDDIVIPRFYINQMMKQFRPGHYHSCYTWTFKKNPQSYWNDRTRVMDNSTGIRYGGAGVSMSDAKIFLDKRLFNVISKEAYEIDDLWISYYCNHILNKPIIYTNIKDLRIGGTDTAALYRKFKRAEVDRKSQFLQKLISAGWDL